MFMDAFPFNQKDALPPLIFSRLSALDLDFAQKYRQIARLNAKGTPCRGAGVVLLLHYQKLKAGNFEYVFQLIKRSVKVAQAGDISCPGGILNPAVDKFLSLLLRCGIIPVTNAKSRFLKNHRNKETYRLVQLFLVNALREAWEEIGLNPFNVDFLGALPSYTLSSFPRTIFPVVCLTRKYFPYRSSDEVEKILEIPLSHFFDVTNYAWLQLTTPIGNNSYDEQVRFPCFVIKNDDGDDDILWGATLQIISNFFTIIFGRSLPFPDAAKILKKEITQGYLAGGRLS
ncbi:MAG TPA: CoA pyrophosphatase [Smithellaceae bacterium]|nr:CoA pyrophosphatase [Smithellaceae bacterium]HRV25850.1 CoA pyrophosphatase [Smithellaceae bacterium]